MRVPLGHCDIPHELNTTRTHTHTRTHAHGHSHTRTRMCAQNRTRAHLHTVVTYKGPKSDGRGRALVELDDGRQISVPEAAVSAND
jgi:hypothetical protein